MHKTSKEIIINYILDNKLNLDIDDILNQFKVYIQNEGWQDWMDKYTTTTYDEEVTDEEDELLENIQAKNFINLI